MILKTILIFFLVLLNACHEKKENATLKVGAIDGPEAFLLETAKDVAKEKYHLDFDIITFSDYNSPNEALNNGSIDVNAFQHLPFLTAQIKERHYKITPIAKTFIYPMGIYSKKIEALADLKERSTVAIPNDPSNEARALLLLAKAHLISLNRGGFDITPVNIKNNPKHLKIVELDAAQLPRSLEDVSLAAINTNYALPAGLSPKNALFKETGDSPYVNLIVIRSKDKHNLQIQNFIKSYQSDAVVQKAKEVFGDGAMPGWKKN